MKEPGQVSYEAFYGKDWPWQAVVERDNWARVEAAVIAAYGKQEGPAGVWVTMWGCLNFLILAESPVERLARIPDQAKPELRGRWWLILRNKEEEADISEADAHRIIEALGGTWPEGKKP